MEHFKQQAEFFGKTFLILDTRGGDLKEFFRHESSRFPLALSSGGIIHTCSKSDLLNCMTESMTSSPDHQCESPRSYDFVVLDGGNLIHSLSVGSMKGR